MLQMMKEFLKQRKLIEEHLEETKNQLMIMLKEFLSIRNDLSFSYGNNSLEKEIEYYWKIEAWLDIELKKICIKIIDTRVSYNHFEFENIKVLISHSLSYEEQRAIIKSLNLETNIERD
ncbi:hypothetical protein FVD15_03510 [Campylobacter volucris]|uniref:Uncharacterized protein n=1 Tax=Campylobacter volucris TaxID=1031542 RepID=A0AAE5YJ41_9BACT|nr:hypothetical protein [Campylobacter volucris]AJC94125.1 hypothetical protein CVOL_0818 [Campylobacter volucris LMG 24379]KAB0580283.1 hypothetical protein F7P61_01365 [Campylobacter volucris]MBF7067550.1 hypothetical protein [Campylobacter volucris]QBL13503.1 hypothetical protein A9460_03820 [Campylobacter volucris]QEL08340.1 hypothetical protein CVOLT_0824 [Campylobacter volucris]